MDANERARSILRRAGLRVTITRATLVAAMLEAHEPVSMDDAVRLCGQNGGDPATIYRNLQALSEAVDKLGGRLILRRGPTLETLRKLVDESDAKAVYWQRLYDPATIERDGSVLTRCA